MALVAAKCTNCGATLTVDNSKDAAICEFCGTAFIVEKAINNYNITNNIHADVVNIITPKEDFEVVANTLVKYKGSSADVVIPSNVTMLAREAFKNCNALRSVYIPSSVKKIGFRCFEYVEPGLIIKVDSLQTWLNIATEENDARRPQDILEVAGERIETLILPEGLEHLNGKAFQGCKSIKKVVFPNSLISIGKGAFANCVGLTDIVFSKSLLSIEAGAFAGCDGLTEVIFPSGIQKIDSGAFADCKNLCKVYLPDTVQEIGCNCFGGCESLANVRLSNNMRTISEEAFSWCSRLRTIDIPKNIHYIDYLAFWGCSSLQEVNINDPECQIKKNAFQGAPYSHEKQSQQNCYVATCVYGSYDCPEVWTLRRFRDDTLASTWYGRAFIHTYYDISPTIVKWFGETAWFKKMWQGKLDKMVASLQAKGVKSTPYKDKDWK